MAMNINNRDKIELSIITINTNTADLLKACLTSIYKYTTNLQFETIVFDNHSSDNSKEILSRYQRVKAIFHDKTLGFAAANNRAVDFASGEYILLLNPDTEIESNVLPEILSFMKGSPFDLMGIRLRLPNGKTQVSTGNFPGLKTMIFQQLYLLAKKTRLIFLIPMLAKISRVPVSQLIQITKFWDPYHNHKVDWVSGAFFLLSRNDFIQNGKFDEGFFLYAEEIDFCLRLLKLGKKIGYYGSDEIFHHSGGYMHKFFEKSFILRNLAMMRFYRKHRSWWEVQYYKISIILTLGLILVWLYIRLLLFQFSDNSNLKARISAYKKLIWILIRNEDQLVYSSYKN
jgi:GT2 family glycosyltransferase